MAFQYTAKNLGEMAGEARFSPEMAATRGLHGDPAEARRDSPDPGRRHDGRLHLAATVPRRPAAAAAVATQCTTLHFVQCTLYVATTVYDTTVYTTVYVL